MQLLVVHQCGGHFSFVFDAPKDHTEEVQVVFGEQGEISLVFSVFEGKLEGKDSCTEIVLQGLT